MEAEYSLMVTFQSREKSAMLSSRNVGVYWCFAQQSLVFIDELGKRLHNEGYLDGVKLFQVITCCAGGKKPRRPHKSEWVKIWQKAFEVDWCKVKLYFQPGSLN